MKLSLVSTFDYYSQTLQKYVLMYRYCLLSIIYVVLEEQLIVKLEIPSITCEHFKKFAVVFNNSQQKNLDQEILEINGVYQENSFHYALDVYPRIKEAIVQSVSDLAPSEDAKRSLTDLDERGVEEPAMVWPSFLSGNPENINCLFY